MHSTAIYLPRLNMSLAKAYENKRKKEKPRSAKLWLPKLMKAQQMDPKKLRRRRWVSGHSAWSTSGKRELRRPLSTKSRCLSRRLLKRLPANESAIKVLRLCCRRNRVEPARLSRSKSSTSKSSPKRKVWPALGHQ